MKQDFKWGLVVGFALGTMLAVAVGLTVTVPQVNRTIRSLDQQDAVKAGAGKWEADKETGAPSFAWRSCNALGVKQ